MQISNLLPSFVPAPPPGADAWAAQVTALTREARLLSQHVADGWNRSTVLADYARELNGVRDETYAATGFLPANMAEAWRAEGGELSRRADGKTELRRWPVARAREVLEVATKARLILIPWAYFDAGAVARLPREARAAITGFLDAARAEGMEPLVLCQIDGFSFDGYLKLDGRLPMNPGVHRATFDALRLVSPVVAALRRDVKGLKAGMRGVADEMERMGGRIDEIARETNRFLRKEAEDRWAEMLSDYREGVALRARTIEAHAAFIARMDADGHRRLSGGSYVIRHEDVHTEDADNFWGFVQTRRTRTEYVAPPGISPMPEFPTKPGTREIPMLEVDASRMTKWLDAYVQAPVDRAGFASCLLLAAPRGMDVCSPGRLDTAKVGPSWGEGFTSILAEAHGLMPHTGDSTP